VVGCAPAVGQPVFIRPLCCGCISVTLLISGGQSPLLIACCYRYSLAYENSASGDHTLPYTCPCHVLGRSAIIGWIPLFCPGRRPAFAGGSNISDPRRFLVSKGWVNVRIWVIPDKIFGLKRWFAQSGRLSVKFNVHMGNLETYFPGRGKVNFLISLWRECCHE